MGVTPQVVENFLRTRERLFGVDDPIFLAQGWEESRPSLRSGTVTRRLAGEAKLAVGQSLLKALEEFAAKDAAERLDVEQEVVTGGNPATVVKRQGAPWDQTMEVEMGTQRLIPGVEHGQKSQLAAQVSAPKIQQRLGDGVKQERESKTFLLARTSGFSSCGRVKTR